MIKYLLLLVILAVYANAQDFHGGTMTYEVMRTSTDDVIVRYHNKFLQIYTSNEKKKFSEICTENCATEKIPADEVRYRRPGAPKEEIKSFNGSFFCDSFDSVQNVLTGSLKTDVKLPRNYDTYDFSYLSGCCDYPIITDVIPTYKPAKFALTADLKIRNETGKPNNPPDASNVPLYFELKFGTTNNTKQLKIIDNDGDMVRCEWSSATCATGGNCNAFSLTNNCTLTLVQSATPRMYSVGILVKDFARNATVFTTPYSTVPLYMIVKVLSPTESNPNPYVCDAKRPIQDQLIGASNMIQMSLPFCLLYVFLSSNLMRFF